jgi:hypothetical protein
MPSSRSLKRVAQQGAAIGLATGPRAWRKIAQDDALMN